MFEEVLRQVGEAFSAIASHGIGKVEERGKKVVVGTLLSLDADAWIVDEDQRLLGVLRAFKSGDPDSVDEFLSHVSQCAYRARLHATLHRAKAWDWHAFVLLDEAGYVNRNEGLASSLSAPIGISTLVVPSDPDQSAELLGAIRRYCRFIGTGKPSLKGRYDWRVLSFFAALFPISRLLLRRESAGVSLHDIRGTVRKALLQKVKEKSKEAALTRWVQVEEIMAMVDRLLGEVTPALGIQAPTKLVRLNSIDIKHLRALGTAFGRFGDLTFIVGGNGSGKSSMVEAIQLVISGKPLGSFESNQEEALANLERGGAPSIVVEALVQEEQQQTTIQLRYPALGNALIEDAGVFLLDQKKVNIVAEDPERRASQLLGLLGGYGEDVLDAIDKRIAEQAACLRAYGLRVNVTSRDFLRQFLEFSGSKFPKPQPVDSDLPTSFHDYPGLIRDLAATWQKFERDSHVDPDSIDVLMMRIERAMNALDEHRSGLEQSASALRKALGLAREWAKTTPLPPQPEVSYVNAEHFLGGKLSAYLSFPSRSDIERAISAAESVARKVERFLEYLVSIPEDTSSEYQELLRARALGNWIQDASTRFLTVLRSSDLLSMCDAISDAIDKDAAARSQMGVEALPHVSRLERLSSEIALAREVLSADSAIPEDTALTEVGAVALLEKAVSIVDRQLETVGRLPDLRECVDVLREARRFFEGGTISGLLRVSMEADVLAMMREQLSLEQSHALTRIIDTDIGICFMEIAAALSASRWAQPDVLIRYEPPKKRKESGKIQLTTLRHYAKDTIPLTSIINFGEQALVNLAWFLVRYAVIGRHLSNLVIVDDPFACLDPAHQEYAVRTLIRLTRTINPNAQVVLALNPQDEVVEMLREMGDALRAPTLLGGEMGEVSVVRTTKVSQYHCEVACGSTGRRVYWPCSEVVASMTSNRQHGHTHSGVRGPKFDDV